MDGSAVISAMNDRAAAARDSAADSGGEPMSPLRWPWALSAPPSLCSEATGWNGALLRRWSGTSAVMEQPPLDQHYVVMHLGGPKHVTRNRDGPSVATVAERGSLTLVPAGTAYTWRTQGPIAFAHLYVPPRQFEDAVSQELDIEGRGASLIERVGCRDALLETMFDRMIREIRRADDASALLLDSLLEQVLSRLARRHASRPAFAGGRTLALAPHRLQRVLDFIEANLDRKLRLADLVTAAGTSQSHFSHAFLTATGQSPYRYLVHRRIERAQALLMTGDASLTDISKQCGFNRSHQFSVMFKEIVGVPPKRYRSERRSRASAPKASRPVGNEEAGKGR